MLCSYRVQVCWKKGHSKLGMEKLPNQSAKHRKVRFGRDDHLDLNSLPSASTHQGRRTFSRGVGILHGVSKTILILVLLISVIIAAMATILATSGISNRYFAGLVQSSLQKLSGPDLVSKIADARLSLDNTGNLAFQAQGVTFVKSDDGVEVANIGNLRMGLKALPLLLGSVEIARVEVDNVAFRKTGDTSAIENALARLKRPDGLYNPGALPQMVHHIVGVVRDQFAAKKVRQVVINNIGFGLADSPLPTLPLVQSLTFLENDVGDLAVSGSVRHASKTLSLSGLIQAQAFELNVAGLSFGVPSLAQPDGELADSTSPISPNGELSFLINGTTNQQIPVLHVDFNLDRLDFRNKRGARILGNGKIRTEIVQNVEKIEILNSRISVGANSSVFTGAIGPDVAGQATDAGYRFELVSDETTISPKDSPEKRISVAVRVAGNASLDKPEIAFSQIGVRSLSGQLFGRGNVKFGTGSPELIFSLDIPEIAVSDAKQLWPSIFAGGARLWVLDHVYGGTLTNSTVNVAYREGSLWPRPANVPIPLPTSEQVSADFTVNNARFDVIGDLPPVRDAQGSVSVRGANTSIKVSKGIAYLENGKTINVANGEMGIPVTTGQPVVAALTIDVSGEASSIAELANKEPINALSKAPITSADLSGTATAHITASFPLRKADNAIEKKWDADVEFKNLSIAKDFSGQKLTEADGRLVVSKSLATLTATGKLNGIPATLEVVEPLVSGTNKREVSAKLTFDDKARAKIAPGLKDILTGPVEVTLDGANGNQTLNADLTKASLSLPWAGWAKGPGIQAQASFTMAKQDRITTIKDLVIKGKSFSITGDIDVVGGSLSKARFSNVSLNKGNKIAVELVKGKDGYDVSVSGAALDLRALLKRVTSSFEKTVAATGGVAIRVKANIGSVIGFNGEQLQNVVASYSGQGSTIRSFTASANSQSGGNIALENKGGGEKRTVEVQTSDGGALLRFMDIYDKMQGGTVRVSLTTNGDGPLVGEVDARNFTIVGEPRLKSLVGAPVSPDGQSLSNVTKNKLEVSKVKFERGNAFIEKGKGYLKLERGILRSDQIGLSYSGTLYDARGRIDMVGTFMPAFGLNRIFSELPIFGEILGNGRDKGLIGITFKLVGNAKSPELTINPMSLIAPGIFRQIFEFQ
jgi:Protein of unknown function